MRRLSVDLESPRPEEILEAVGVLQRGGLVAFPTETLYGLTCDPRDGEAIRALYRLKERSSALRLPFVASDPSQAALLVSLDSRAAKLLTERFWPGPLTLVLPLAGRSRLAPRDWGESLAIRVPASPVARRLAQAAAVPLPATSLNRSGEPPVSNPDRVPVRLAAGLDLLLDGGPLPEGPPSTLLDLTGPVPRLLRPGALPAEALEELLGSTALPLLV